MKSPSTFTLLLAAALALTVRADHANGVVTIICEGEEGVAITGTDGAVAKVTVKIASDVTPGDYIVKINSAQLTEPGTSATIHNNTKAVEFT